MAKLNGIVKKETIYITAWVIILSVLMQSIFLIIGAWDYKVLLGNILSASGAVVNFLLLGITVQKAVLKDKDGAKKLIKFSQTMRLLLMVVIAVISATVPVFNIWAGIIPLLFPRIAILIRPLFNKKGGGGSDE